MSRYVYATVKFVPDVARGEFINVGVIVGSDETGEWGLQRLRNASRAIAFAWDDAPLLQAMWEEMDDVEAMIAQMASTGELPEHLTGREDVRPLTEQWLRLLHDSCHRGFNQYGFPAPMSADSLQVALATAARWKLLDPPEDKASLLAQLAVDSLAPVRMENAPVTG